MPDTKRKLPVLYVPTIDGAPDFDTRECDDGQTESLVIAFASDKYLERYNNERIDAGFAPVEMALYEPAIPRCRTCNCFAPLTSGDKALCSLNSRLQPHYVPADGSGYCNEHPGARRD